MLAMDRCSRTAAVRERYLQGGCDTNITVLALPADKEPSRATDVVRRRLTIH
jgi:hypothetical protein